MAYLTMEKKHILKVIAENVRTLMNQEGLSSTEIARRCHVSTGTISKIINGNMSITVPMAINIAEGLGVDISDILKGLIVKKAQEEIGEQTKIKIEDQLSIGVLSINNKRITCVKDYKGNVIGASELEGGLDLAETTGSLISLIQESIHEALPQVNDKRLKLADVNLVTQSYEFEDTRNKFALFAKKYFHDVIMLPDWIITYLAAFENNPGISLVVDKGVSLSYMNNGSLKKLGGWKFPVYDFGGENWLGAETIHHTIEAAEGYVPMSNLARSVLAKFNGKIEKITETCFKGADSDIYCLFAEPLLRSYFTGDKAAQAIIERGFKEIYKAIDKVDQITGKKLKIAINGSLTDIYTSFFDKNRLIPASSEAEKARLLANVSRELLEKCGVKSL